jgi:hypothetical protein
MASDRPENGRTDVDPTVAQHDMRQSHGSSPTTSTHDTGMPQPSAPQIGPPYGLQTVVPPQTQQMQDNMGSTTLAVTNLPYRIRWQDLKDLFRRYGTPSRADVFLAPDGRSRGVGMVSMRTRREAETCVNDLNGYEWFGRKIGVKIDETGGHHALAAAAMAGATIWESGGFTSNEYEVLLSLSVDLSIPTCPLHRFSLVIRLPVIAWEDARGRIVAFMGQSRLNIFEQ